jgi:hypothetical protein
MRLALFFPAVLLALASMSQKVDSLQTVPDTATFPSGDLRLKGLLWKPVSNKPVPAVLFNHGSENRSFNYLARLAEAKTIPISFIGLLSLVIGFTTDRRNYTKRKPRVN